MVVFPIKTGSRVGHIKGLVTSLYICNSIYHGQKQQSHLAFQLFVSLNHSLLTVVAVLIHLIECVSSVFILITYEHMTDAICNSEGRSFEGTW